MNKRLIIEEYYMKLNYNFMPPTGRIRNVDEEFIVDDINNFSERFLKTASIIEKRCFFKFLCNHIDSANTIIKYLNYFGEKIKLDNIYDKECKTYDVILTILVTSLYKHDVLKDVLYTTIVTNSTLDKSILNEDVHGHISYWCGIIILANSDLHAFAKYLSTASRSIYFKTWIQEAIKEQFEWLINKYFKNSKIPLITFQTKEELFTLVNIPNRYNVVSIWTEDIVFAKNLAMSLNKDILLINTNIDSCNTLIVLPYSKILYKNTIPLKKCTPNFDELVKKSSVKKSLVYDLYYDGMWQKPVKDTYWIHNDSQIANATSDDINKCIDSANKGFEIWSSKSIDKRIQILFKFASILKYNNFKLANVLTDWIKKLSFNYENSTSYSERDGLEILKIRNPMGVIILKEGTEKTTLFLRLMQILIVGNSVIVISDKKSCLAEYFHMSSISDNEIPPGVINFLSSENINKLELLCRTDYASYEKRFWTGNNAEVCINLTKPKHIILPFK